MSRPITCPLCSTPVAVLHIGTIEVHVIPGTFVFCDAGGHLAPFRATTTSDGPFPASIVPAVIASPVDANGSPAGDV